MTLIVIEFFNIYSIKSVITKVVCFSVSLQNNLCGNEESKRPVKESEL